MNCESCGVETDERFLLATEEGAAVCLICVLEELKAAGKSYDVDTENGRIKVSY